MRRLSLVVLAAAVAGATTTSSFAQAWRMQPRVQREIQNDIRELDMRIARAIERRVISRGDARGIQKEAEWLRRDFDRFSRDGLNRREVEELESQINRLRVRLHLERRQWSGGRR